MSKPENYAEDEVTCPYCQTEVSDSWELDDYGTRECWNCDKKYEYNRDVCVTYSATGIDESEEES